MQFYDNRGTLTSIKNNLFEVKEILLSNNYKNVIRGLHLSPYQKKIIVLKGSIYDFSINPFTKEIKEVVLNVGESIIIQGGWAHGFYSIEDSEIIYLLGGVYNENIDKSIYWLDPQFNFKYNFPKTHLILSDKDKNSMYFKKYDYYVLGAKGFLGSQCVSILKDQGYEVFESNERLNNIHKIKEEIIKSQAKYIICAAGISGKPTIEWCEKNEEETYNTNYLETVELLKLTNLLNIHCTVFGSGSVYSGKKQSYCEEDIPDNTEKVYCKWRVRLEEVIKFYNNVLYLRIIYPITCDGNSKCFLTKMLGRTDSVHNISVPITVVPYLFPKISTLCKKNITGIMNFVNKGIISLPNLLNLYSNYNKNIIYTINYDSTNNRGGYELLTNKLDNYIQNIDINSAIISIYNK